MSNGTRASHLPLCRLVPHILAPIQGVLAETHCLLCGANGGTTNGTTATTTTRKTQSIWCRKKREEEKQQQQQQTDQSINRAESSTH